MFKIETAPSDGNDECKQSEVDDVNTVPSKIQGEVRAPKYYPS